MLVALERDDEANIAYEEAVRLNPDYRGKGNWSRSGFGRFVSPDLVAEEFLDSEVIILMQGDNLFGDLIFSYTRYTGRQLRQMFGKMQAGEDVRPADFGEVLASGRGEPSEALVEEMRVKHNMIPIDMPSRASTLIPLASPEE